MHPADSILVVSSISPGINWRRGSLITLQFSPDGNFNNLGMFTAETSIIDIMN